MANTAMSFTGGNFFHAFGFRKSLESFNKGIDLLKIAVQETFVVRVSELKVLIHSLASFKIQDRESQSL